MQLCYIEFCIWNVKDIELGQYSFSIPVILMLLVMFRKVMCRCYPKVDGSIYVYDPKEKQTPEEMTNLTEELSLKVGFINFI